MPKNTRTLVLNSDFTALGIVSWKRAVVLGWMNQEDPNIGLLIVDYYKNDEIIASGHKKFPVPAVAVVPKYTKRKANSVPFSRKNLFLRDQLTCQYCGFCDGTTTNLTYDHVIPRAQWKKLKYKGTPTHWSNIVTCCNKCNKTKADRTPKEADMKLLREPDSPSPHQYILGLSPWCRVPEEWEPYLTPLYKHLKRKEN
jgi:hypothetical protein